MDLLDLSVVTYAHIQNPAVRFRQYASYPVPVWAIDVRPGRTDREMLAKTVPVSDARLLEIAELLEAMCPKVKAPSDGLGIYLGNGMLRPQFKNDYLRSVELSEALRELYTLRRTMADLDGEPE